MDGANRTVTDHYVRSESHLLTIFFEEELVINIKLSPSISYKSQNKFQDMLGKEQENEL